MCECGCIESEVRYTIPGPGKSFYILALYGGCVDCDAPSGITVQTITPKNTLYKDYLAGEFVDGPLKFDSWQGVPSVAITTGHTKSEFIKALLQHLVGLDSKEMGEKGKIDKDGAEVILDEMYDDAVVKPQVVAAQTPSIDPQRGGDSRGTGCAVPSSPKE